MTRPTGQPRRPKRGAYDPLLPPVRDPEYGPVFLEPPPPDDLDEPVPSPQENQQ